MKMLVTGDEFADSALGGASVDPNFEIWTYDFISSALATARTGSWQLDLHTGLVTWDATTSDIFGLDMGAVTTGALLPVHEDDQAALWESLQRSEETGDLNRPGIAGGPNS